LSGCRATWRFTTKRALFQSACDQYEAILSIFRGERAGGFSWRANQNCRSLLFLRKSTVSIIITTATMKLTTAALILFGSTFGATAFVPHVGTPFVPGVAARGVKRAPLFMSEATVTEEATGETFE